MTNGSARRNEKRRRRWERIRRARGQSPTGDALVSRGFPRVLCVLRSRVALRLSAPLRLTAFNQCPMTQAHWYLLRREKVEADE